MHNFSIVFYAPFFLLILNLKIRRYLLYGLSFGFLLTILFFTKWTSLDGWSISFSLLLCLLTVIVFDSYKGVLRSVYVGYIVSLFLLFGIIESNQHHKSTSVLPQMNATISSINAINVTYQKAKQYRPINFVEQCVDNNSDNVIRMGTSLEVLFHYLHKVILPYPLSYYYGFQFISPKSIFSILPIVSLLLHLGLLFLFVYCSHRNKILSFGILVYLVSILIFSGYFPPIPGMIGDRYLLIPSLGWAIIVIIVFLSLFKNIFSISDVWERKGTIVRYSFLGLLLIYSVISFSRNRNWNNHLTLYRHDIVYVANSAHAHNLLALRLMKESFEAKDVNNQLSLRREASEHFRKAIAIYPEFFNANYDLARTYYLLNMPDSAIFYFSKTFKLNPEFSDAPLAAGNILLENERYSEAKPFFELIVLHRPNVYVGYEKLNYIFFKQNDYQKAIAINKDAIFKIPNIIQPYISIAKIYHSIGKDDSTRFWLQKGLQLSPNDDEATKLLQSLNK
jgi:tetratricopeptide (TPR) repeat protein